MNHLVKPANTIYCHSSHLCEKLTLEPFLRDHESIPIEFFLENTVADLKSKILKMIPQNSKNLFLFIGDVCLRDDTRLLKYYGLTKEFPLRIVFVSFLRWKLDEFSAIISPNYFQFR